MDEQQNIQPMQSDFEQIKKTDADGKNYWSARELSNVMGYSTWQKFNRVLNKALQVAQSRGMNISEHFNQTVEMVKLGSVTFRKVDNWHLSRLACLVIAENADSKKPQVQTARQYFKEQTPATVLIESQVSSRILLYKTNQGETRIEMPSLPKLSATEASTAATGQRGSQLNLKDLTNVRPPSPSENISLENITEGRVAIATPPKPI